MSSTCFSRVIASSRRPQEKDQAFVGEDGRGHGIKLARPFNFRERLRKMSKRQEVGCVPVVCPCVPRIQCQMARLNSRSAVATSHAPHIEAKARELCASAEVSSNSTAFWPQPKL